MVFYVKVYICSVPVDGIIKIRVSCELNVALRLRVVRAVFFIYVSADLYAGPQFLITYDFVCDGKESDIA